MSPAPWALFLGLVVVTAGLPIVFATRRPPLRTALLYGHIGFLQLVRGFLSAVYAIPLTDGLTVAPGNVMYAALMMTAVLMVLVERRPQVLRNVIVLLVATEVLKLAVFVTTQWALSSPDFMNIIGLRPDPYGNFIVFSGIGSVLIIAELLLVVGVFGRLRRWIERTTVLALLYVAVFAGVVVLDGVLFPSATRLLEPGLSAAIAGSVERKVLLAVLYAAPLLAFVLIYRGAMERYRDAPLRVREVLFAPKQHLVRELEQQEHERIQLLERVARVAEEERQRLAEDLHDDAIQLLTAADIRLQTTMRDAPDADLEPARRLLRGGVESLRRLILEQRGPDVTADSFADLVGAYADRLLPADGVELDIDVQLPDDVPPEVIAAAYRIVLEALSNVARHAAAGTASDTVTSREDLLVGAVTDDGVGIPVDAETGPGHLGLRAMRDRAAMVGGRVTVTPADGGTVVSFELPLR